MGQSLGKKCFSTQPPPQPDEYYASQPVTVNEECEEPPEDSDNTSDSECESLTEVASNGQPIHKSEGSSSDEEKQEDDEKAAEAEDEDSEVGGRRKEKPQPLLKRSKMKKSTKTLPYKKVAKEFGVMEESMINKILMSFKQGEAWDDPFFPSKDSSIYRGPRKKDSGIKWRGPSDLVDDPQLFMEGSDRQDVLEGAVTDSWFLCACTAVALEPKLMERVMKASQNLSKEGHGLIVVNFWRFGQWVMVPVDDLLPVRSDQLIYARCSLDNEFWIAMLEKAYAKLHGCYEALHSGDPVAALTDLTGGITERFYLSDEEQDIFKHMHRSQRSGSIITCAILEEEGETNDTVNGLVKSQDYTVTQVVRVQHDTEGIVDLVRLKSPWGVVTDWSGPWNDNDSHWEGVDEVTRKKLDIINEGDGEFWMDFEDFSNKFSEVIICNLGQNYGRLVSEKGGKALSLSGCWRKGVNAGGARTSDMKSFATNPQYMLVVERMAKRRGSLGSVRSLLQLQHDKGKKAPTDDSADTGLARDNMWAIVSLMQEYRKTSQHSKTKLHPIGITVYKVPRAKLIRDAEFKFRMPVAKTPMHTFSRETSLRLDLTPGIYIIVPSTFQPDCETDFLLRTFTSGVSAKLTKLR